MIIKVINLEISVCIFIGAMVLDNDFRTISQRFSCFFLILKLKWHKRIVPDLAFKKNRKAYTKYVTIRKSYSVKHTKANKSEIKLKVLRLYSNLLKNTSNMQDHYIKKHFRRFAFAFALNSKASLAI